MRLRIVALAVLPVLIAGCEFFSEPEQGKMGFVSFMTLASGGGFVLNPIGAFYGTSNIQFELAPAGACVTRPYVSGTDGALPGANTVDAGPFVFLDQAARRDTLTGVEQFQYRLYRNLSGVVPVTPGDEIRVTVTGGRGFPAVELPIVTAEEFAISNPFEPGENEPMTFTWSPPAAPGSLLSVALRYARIDTPGATNEQLICVFEDVGQAEIPASFLVNWRASAAEDRDFAATRTRTATASPGSNSTITLISTFSLPTPILQ